MRRIFRIQTSIRTYISGFLINLQNSIDRAINTYDNVVSMGDININTQDHQSQGINKLFEFCDIFGLQNLMKSSTKTSSTMIDVILTNRERSFRHSKTVETGISDFHKLVMTSFRLTCQRLKSDIEVIRLLTKMLFWQT